MKRKFERKEQSNEREREKEREREREKNDFLNINIPVFLNPQTKFWKIEINKVDICSLEHDWSCVQKYGIIILVNMIKSTYSFKVPNK